MSADNVVSAEIRVVANGVSETRTDLRATQREVLALGEAGATAGHGAREHGGAMGFLSERIREYRMEMSQERRMSFVLARDIASMGLASRGAALEVTSLVSAFTVGGVMGIAVEGVKMLVEKIGEIEGEADKNKQAVASFAIESTNKIHALNAEITKMILQMVNAPKAVMLTQEKVVPLMADEIKLNGQLAAAKQALKREQDAIYASSMAIISVERTQAQKEADAHRDAIRLTKDEREQVEKLEKAIAAKHRAVVAAQEGVNLIAGLDEGEKAAEKANKELEIERAHHLKMLEFAEQAEVGVAQIHAKYGVQRQQMTNNENLKGEKATIELNALREREEAEVAQYMQKLSRETMSAEVAAETVGTNEIVKLRAALAIKLDELRQRANKTHDKGEGDLLLRQMLAASGEEKAQEDLINQKYADKQEQRENEVQQKITALRQHWMEQRLQIEKNFEKEEKKDYTEQLKEQFAVLKSIGSEMGNVFGGMIAGSMSVGAAVVAMAKTGVKALIDMEIKAIEAHALAAASGAAESQAAIPIVGPALAVGAMAAMEGLVLGLLSSMPSAAGGFDIPRGVNPITQLHGGEMVLPQPLAEAIRGMASGGGGGGHIFHFNFPAGSVVDASWWRANRSHIVRELRGAVGDRVLSLRPGPR